MTGAACAAVARSLDAIDRRNPAVNAFTFVRREAALTEASAIDAAPGTLALAGSCFAVKDLFDVAGEITRAGSVILNDAPAAKRDAFVVARLRAAGAVLLGRLNMDEFAYGFSTENAHYGATRNPHDEDRIAGGSSGGSAAAVATGMVPLALGSDTNGSIRIPAALCGIYGLKPTYGRLSRRGTFPFVASLDHVGPMAATLEGLALAFDVMQGQDPEDPVAAEEPPITSESALNEDTSGLRIARLGGWFGTVLTREVRAAYEDFLGAARISNVAILEGSKEARSAAFSLSAAEGGQLHAERLRSGARLFDPATRDRLIAGALLPAASLLRAQRFRSWYRERARALFQNHDILIAPTTFTTAPRVGEASVAVDGQSIPVRANLGLYTQPLSFIGLPVLTVPIKTDGLPIGIQIIAAPWHEAHLLSIAAHFKRIGLLMDWLQSSG